jgi:hypothetical protein
VSLQKEMKSRCLSLIYFSTNFTSCATEERLLYSLLNTKERVKSVAANISRVYLLNKIFLDRDFTTPAAVV